MKDYSTAHCFTLALDAVVSNPRPKQKPPNVSPSEGFFEFQSAFVKRSNRLRAWALLPPLALPLVLLSPAWSRSPLRAGRSPSPPELARLLMQARFRSPLPVAPP